MLTLYVDLPDTPLRASVPDQRQARSWFDRGVPLPVVETALLLACISAVPRAPPTCRHCRESVHWPTSNPSLRNSWNILFPAAILNTYASSSAALSITPAGQSSEIYVFR